MTVSETTPDRPQSQPVTFRTNDQMLAWAYGEYWRNRPKGTSSTEQWESAVTQVPAVVSIGMVPAEGETGLNRGVSNRRAEDISGENGGAARVTALTAPDRTPLIQQEAG